MNWFIEKVYAAPGVQDFPLGAGSSGVAEFDAFLNRVNTQILTPIVFLLFALAIFWFVWGMLKFIQNAENPSERQKGFDHMKWSVIGLFIMVSVKGIINVVLRTLF